MDFVVIKVNGKDVSSASHEDTIAAFTTAKEPIIVEVLKRAPKQDHMGSKPVSLLCDTSCQTEWSAKDWEPQFPFSPTSFIPLPEHSPFPSNDAEEHHYSTIPGDVEEEDGCDVEYEEVILHRSNQESKLGLTLCYGAPDEPDTDIYISEVDPDSAAARDGRIQEGDQLLQINGVDVRSREQAVSLFSAKRSDFTLLLARPQVLEHDEEEEDGTTDTGTTENALHEKDSGVGRTDESTRNDESSEQEIADIYSYPEAISCRNLLFKSHNSIATGTDSKELFSNDAFGRQDFQKLRSQFTNKGVTLAPLCRFQSDASLDREMALLNKEMENIQLECETLVHKHMESQNKGGNPSEVSKCQLEHVYVNLTDLQAMKNGQELKTPLSKKQTVERWVNNMFLPMKYSNGQPDRDSSSAYNTADSSGSGPLTMELTPVSSRYNDIFGSVMSLVSPKMEDKGTQLRDSDVASMFSCDSCRRCCKALVERQDISSTFTSIPKSYTTVNNNITSNIAPNKTFQNKTYQYMSEGEATFDRQRDERNKNYVTFFPGPNTMYTNQANLQHTIWLQQQMLRQAMAQQKVPRNASSCPSTPSGSSNRSLGINPKHVISTLNKTESSAGIIFQNGQITSSTSKSATLSTVREDEEMKMEWKVKRRADGTRYITRRPVRNRLLKARAMKILEERAGITTDDDAVSELKTGRYWSKEDRKRHLEKSRDRKRKEMIIRSKMCSVKEQGEDGDEGKKELNILELSHKKMMKRRGKVVFDDFTTIQEVLAHGTKVSNSSAKPLGLLTVTTV